MRKVTRGTCPDSLRTHSDTWTKEFLVALSSVNNDFSKVPKKYINKYNQADVKEALANMYTNHCCYCESLLGVQTYGRIEHLKPKALPQFHNLIFDWENLHWCCEICNTSYKKNNWNFENPILDPSKDNIEDYLKLDTTTGRYVAINDNPRAKTTRDHTGLNREELVESRRKLILRMTKNFRQYKLNNLADSYIKDLSMLKEDYDYPSLFNEMITIFRQNLNT